MIASHTPMITKGAQVLIRLRFWICVSGTYYLRWHIGCYEKLPVLIRKPEQKESVCGPGSPILWAIWLGRLSGVIVPGMLLSPEKSGMTGHRLAGGHGQIFPAWAGFRSTHCDRQISISLPKDVQAIIPRIHESVTLHGQVIFAKGS